MREVWRGLSDKCFAKSKSDARRLIESGAVSINETKILGGFDPVPTDAGENFILHKGKKNHIKVQLV